MAAQDTPHRNQKQTVRFYDAEASTYDASRYAHGPGRRLDVFHKRVLQRHLFSGLPADAAVLELGCGTCRLLTHFRATHAVVGIDASPGMLRIGADRLGGTTGLLQGDAYHLPFGDGAFDAAYSILVINLLPDYERAFAEVARVLRPGGRFLFNVPNLESMYAPGGLYVNLQGRTTGRNRAGYRYSHWFRRREVEAALGRAGLRVRAIVGQPPLLSIWPLNLELSGTLPVALLCKSRYFVASKPGPD